MDVPEEIAEIIDLYYLAQEYQVMDLMWRCEEEINLKISPVNVVDVLVKYSPLLKRDIEEVADLNEEEQK